MEGKSQHKQKPSKTVEFKKLLNFRDIGGIPVSGEGMLKKGIVFRSANPDRLRGSDIDKLISSNIRTIIDLRAPGELNKNYVSPDHIERLSLPLDFQQTTRERMKPFIFMKDAQSALADISNDIYIEILDASAHVFRQIMETLATPGRSPVLIHCQAGKDRTGIIIALIMLAMGVERQLILNDFMKSNDALLPYFKRHFLFRKIISFGYFPYRNMLFAVAVKQRNIESVLDRIENHYGGIGAYLRSAGFDMTLLEKVRNILISSVNTADLLPND